MGAVLDGRQSGCAAADPGARCVETLRVYHAGVSDLACVHHLSHLTHDLDKLFDYHRGGTPTNFGLQNYVAAFQDPALLTAIRNNVLWIIFVPLFAVSLGLIIAVLVDRIKWEKYAKSLVFLPMAISFVGAAVIWRFIYYFAPYGEQIGLLNAIVVGLGGEAVGWLRIEPWNNFLLIVIMIWLQTGFAMVILSSAVKGVPSSLLEAARIDGASEVPHLFPGHHSVCQRCDSDRNHDDRHSGAERSLTSCLS